MVAVLAAVALAQTSIVAISHRGDNKNYPENTMPAYESSLRLGADYIEVDVRTTSDGFLVAIHDETLDRTTNGTGLVSAHTLAEIRALDAGGWFAPEFAGLQVPLFEDVVALVAGMAGRGIYVDLKMASAQDLYDALAKQELQHRVVVYSGPGRLKQLQIIDAAVLVMPEAVNTLVLNASIAFFDPLRVVAFNDNDFKDRVIELAQSIDADIYVDRLGDADVPEVWQDAINRGATGIQTDKPGPLVEYLVASGYHA